MKDGKGRVDGDDIQIIDLGMNRKGKLDESFLRMFGTAVKGILKKMFGSGNRVPFKFKGNKDELNSFASAINNEKKYIDAFMRYGLDDPKTLKRKGKLDSAVKKFTRKTGIKWPFD